MQRKLKAKESIIGVSILSNFNIILEKTAQIFKNLIKFLNSLNFRLSDLLIYVIFHIFLFHTH